jgi:hypothetical protein
MVKEKTRSKAYFCALSPCGKGVIIFSKNFNPFYTKGVL